MEHEPNEYGASLEINGQKVELTPENSGAFVHHNQEEYDHLVIRQGDGWARIYRRVIRNFDDVVKYMMENNFNIYVEDYPDQQDIDAYHKTYGYDPIKPFDELTPRQERKLAFARYLLDRMTAEDFNEHQP